MSFELTVVDPERIAWKGSAKDVILGIGDGLYGIRTGHADAVMLLSPSVLKITTDADSKESFFLSGGCVRIEKGAVTILANSTESKDKINVDRARQALERARTRLNGSAKDIDYTRARIALQRAITRLNFADVSVDNL
ncbi:MAG: hypothetical protein RL318_1853 [Fibrobacterota bacterium]